MTFFKQETYAFALNFGVPSSANQEADLVTRQSARCDMALTWPEENVVANDLCIAMDKNVLPC